jgi:hypothetical protein
MRPLNIQENIATLDEVKALTDRKLGAIESLARRILHRPASPAPTYFTEKQFHFDPDILKLRGDFYLDGYWQSEKYFANIDRLIAQEFTVKTPQTGRDKEVAEQMSSCDSVSLHIRRGSYLTPPHNTVIEPRPLTYYHRCVDRIAQTVKNPHFYIFSDDFQWVRNNLKLAYKTTFVDHNKSDKDYEDLRLISLCKHNIVANSTFSWWGAWLNKNPRKIVLSPAEWFKDTSLNTRDLTPESWVKISDV